MMKSDILDVLSKEQYFLMYRGGAGGEFLTSLIINKSDRFRKIEYVYTNETNRTELKLPMFYQCLSAVKTKSKSMDVLIDKIVHAHSTFNYPLKDSIAEAHEFLNDHKPPLLRIHYTFSDYFTKNNTWLIIQDDPVWFEYTRLVLFLKTGLSPIDINQAKNIFYYSLACFPDKKEKMDQALEYLKTNNVQHIYAVQSEPLTSYTIDLSFDEIFTTDPIELFRKYYKHFDQPYESFYKSTMSAMGDRCILIPFSKLFQSGYLEEMFNIENATSEFLKWHNTNLSLMNKHGFDTSKWEI